uniref:Uncharacterized protein n=1 Tax=Solanum lycopersicum TaxID=4081 RepID=A0A3Q7FW14_SOLLC
MIPFSLDGLEAQAVLSSSEFENILDMSLKTVVDVMMEDIKVLCGETNLKLGIPLRDRYIQIVQNILPVTTVLPPPDELITLEIQGGLRNTFRVSL